MTGTYVRTKRNGKWTKVEFDQLTDGEMQEFSERQPDDGWKWAIFFAKWIRDNITARKEQSWKEFNSD